MPHSVSPQSTQTQDAPMANTQPENGATEDIKMEDGEAATETKRTVNLDDMFGDGDSDDEYSSSAPVVKDEIPSSPPVPAPVSRNASNSDTEVMRAFYQRLCPFRYLFQWLNHSPVPTADFMHREFAFTVPRGADDVYLRYQSFLTADLLRKQCVQMVPSRFEIGPQYTTDPRERKTLRKASAFRPIKKELVFDIDMTDYDDIRACCKGASICHKCWTFITMAIKVVDKALREDFGFELILWVYSGRRGAHAWVCDKKAREMDDTRRRAIAGYLELLKGGDKSGKKVNIKRPLHPHLTRSLNLLSSHFQEDVLISQDPWASEDKAAHLLSLIPDLKLREALQKKWDSSPGRASISKWGDIDKSAESGVSASLDKKALLNAKQDIVLEYTYPRLDAEVSKKLIHLLKSPFCVHPGTGRICVPIDTRKLEEFDPFSVPTVTQCLGEIDSWEGGDETEGRTINDWEKTSLKEYIDYFRSFVAEVIKEEGRGKRERGDDDDMEF
ncbi:prim-pol domain-containing protein [Pseudovirgaria hyperparasitica]|uniref:DNA primase n=1 Tax=Pseudovirgaria hyperparasitica TaxID=470096 RepID=A0A6A6WBZ0_9PEZI|nr:prim-pol domain-containing protein [Pseudovirgaria hyperparasitica]KAF2760095.1 prim-pol domain-containing protein [Pseudovirgaria hyperparasitica]